MSETRPRSVTQSKPNTDEPLGETVIPGQGSGDLDKTTAPPQAFQGKNMDQASGPAAKGSEKKSGDTASGATDSGVTQIGKYKIVKKLGQGGMGEVYLGEDMKLGRKAAIKVLSKGLAGKGDFVERFYREARSMAKMNHDNAVSVYDVDQDDGLHYVAMEFVDGKSMQGWMDKLGKLAVGDALHVTLRCAEALQVAHNQSMVHRDIKPDNVMMTTKGKVKVADFGLAKATDEDMSMTQSGTGLGTPYYMAPEQARNAKHVDGRTDIYALGITLYYFLTGKLPFSGNSALEVIMNKEKGQFVAARRITPEVPEKLDLIIDKMIAKDLNVRCKDCAEVIKLLSSLGLESPSLSFIDAPDKVVQTAAGSAAAGSTRAGQSMMQTPRAATTSGIPKTSAEDAASKSSPPSSATTAQAWIVQYKTAQGKDTISKLTTAQIQAGLKSGTLDAKAKCKKSAADQFLPIAHFPEFARQVESRLIKDKADKKAGDMKSIYADIDRQYGRRGWTRWFKNLASGTYGLITLIAWLLIIFGGLGAIVLFRQEIWNKLANSVNSAQTTTAAPAATGGQPSPPAQPGAAK